MLTLGKTQWAFAVIVVLVLFPAILSILYADELEAAYLRHFVRPSLEREFGFRSTIKNVVHANRTYPVLMIESLDEGGVLATAGVRPGDVPIHGLYIRDSYFYRTLRKARTEAVRIDFIDSEVYFRSIEGNYNEIIDNKREYVISLNAR